MHPNIKLVVSSSADASLGVSLTDFMALPSPPPTDTDSTSAKKSGKVSLDDFMDNPDPLAIGANGQPAGVKKDIQRSLVARIPALAEISENERNISYRRVHIIPPSENVTGSEDRLMVLLVPAVEKIISGLDYDGLLALGECLDENWGDTVPKDNQEAAKVKAIFARRGYEITKATVESGQLFLSIYKKQFSGFMKMSRPNIRDTGYASLPQWRRQPIDSTQSHSSPAPLISKSQASRNRQSLSSSATMDNLRARAAQSPSPLYHRTRILRPSGSTTDIRSSVKQTQEPKAGVQAPGLSKKVSMHLIPNVPLDDVTKPKLGPHRLRRTISRRNLFVDPALNSLAGKTSSLQLRQPVGVLSLRPGAPADIQHDRAKALERTVEFGKKLMEKIDLDNGGHIASQAAADDRKPTAKKASETSWNKTSDKIATTDDQNRTAETKTGVTTGNYQSTSNYRSAALSPAAGNILCSGHRMATKHGHGNNTSKADSLMKTHRSSGTHSSPEFTGEHVGNCAGPRAATAMGAKGQAPMPGFTKRKPTQRYGRDIQWN